MNFAATCASLLARCVNIMKALGLVCEHLRPAPVTLTALATERFVLHQALTRVRRDVLKVPNEVVDSELLQTLDAFLIGCKITISAVEEPTDEISRATRILSLPGTLEESAPEEGTRLQRLWNEERMNQFRLQLNAYRTSLPDRFIGDLIEAAEQEQPHRPDFDSATINGNANHARISFAARPSSRNSSNQARGYTYSGPVFPAPQGPGSRLGNIRLIAHDAEDERATSLLGAATRNLDLVNLSKATPEQIQQLQLQSRIIVSRETLRSTFTASRHKYSHEKEVAARPQERKFSKDFNVVVAWAGGVGKSALVIQLIQSRFVDEYDPTMEDIYRKSITIDGIPAIVDVLDTTGQEEYAAMREQYMRMGEGFVLIFSITSRESFANTFELCNEISRVRKTKAWPRVLVANHSVRESERHVSGPEGKGLPRELDCPFLKVSSTTLVHVDNVFEAIVREIRYRNAMGTTTVNQSTHSGGAALNATRPRRSIKDNTIDRVDGRTRTCASAPAGGGEVETLK